MNIKLVPLHLSIFLKNELLKSSPLIPEIDDNWNEITDQKEIYTKTNHIKSYIDSYFRPFYQIKKTQDGRDIKWYKLDLLNWKILWLERELEVEKLDFWKFYYWIFKVWDNEGNFDDKKVVQDNEVKYEIPENSNIIDNYYLWLYIKDEIKDKDDWFLLEWYVFIIEKNKKNIRKQIHILLEKLFNVWKVNIDYQVKKDKIDNLSRCIKKIKVKWKTKAKNIFTFLSNQDIADDDINIEMFVWYKDMTSLLKKIVWNKEIDNFIIEDYKFQTLINDKRKKETIDLDLTDSELVDDYILTIKEDIWMTTSDYAVFDNFLNKCKNYIISKYSKKI